MNILILLPYCVLRRVFCLFAGDSGSETTSETASLDLEFFSSGVASVTSSQSNKGQSSSSYI